MSGEFEEAVEEELIDEIRGFRKQKPFSEVINRRRLSRHELEEVMV